MNWEPAIQRVTEHIVRIETPSGHGTGFLAFYNADKSCCGIATAAHVIKRADDWLEPIKIRNASGVKLLTKDQRVMFVDGISDCAIVFFLKEDFKLPDVPITLRPISSPCGIGVEIGWLGYPAIDPDTACFFSGTISARKEARRAYFIDGVAINGVSGGPVFHIPSSEADDIEIIGAISDYYPNMALGQPLPGLAQARDVSHFHAIAGHIKSIDEANAANQQFNLANALTAGTGPTIMETTLIPNNTLTAK